MDIERKLGNKKISKSNKNIIKNESKPEFKLDINGKNTFKSRSGLLSKHTIKNDIKRKDDALKRSDEKLKKLTKKVPICVPEYKPKINNYCFKKKNIKEKINNVLIIYKIILLNLNL